jgi:hypothetical protein
MQDQRFSNIKVTKKRLHGKDGLHVRLYGVADALRSQLVQKGPDAALLLVTPKSLLGDP